MNTLRQPRNGFTLLEVLLTLSMSVVLMLLIGGAMQFYGRDMNVSDMDARQTQLAAAIMQMIEDDLRATLHSDPLDTTGLEDLFSSIASQAGGAADAGGAAQAGGGGGGDVTAPPDDSATDPSLVDESATTADLTTGAAVLEEPGLIGNQYQIQIDISRMPRLEEYYVMFDALTGNIDDVPSEMKTVTYYVQPAGTTGGVGDPLSAVDTASSAPANQLAGGGLVRRSLDRAATEFASLNGNLASLNQTGELLAPEVTGLEFSYWDGLIWQLEWSSDEYGELPLAVQVTLSMIDPVAASSATDPEQAVRTFKHVIRLPMARPIEEEEEEEQEADLSGAGI